MNILVTGVGGFSGRHLAEFLSRKSSGRIIGAYRRERPKGLPRKIVLERADLSDIKSVERLVKKYKPAEVYHVAALVKEKNGPARPEDLFRSNILGTSHLLHALKEYSPRARILNVGSSYEYGLVPARAMPIKETQLLSPHTPYALSKTAQEEAARYYERVYGMRVLYTRTFYYAGPGQPKGFLFSNLTGEILAEEKKKRPVLQLINPEDRFDYTDIRDVARAYYLLMKKGKIGESYNVCSGRAVSVKTIAMKMLGEAHGKFTVRVKRTARGPLDITDYYGSSRKLAKQTGWKPAFSLSATVRDTFASARGKKK